MLSIFMFTSCAVSKVPYNSSEDESKKSFQFYENNECRYIVGTFDIGDKLEIEELIKKTIKKANENGLFGDELINIQIDEGGYTTLLVSKLCLYINGNIIYSKKIRYQ